MEKYKFGINESNKSLWDKQFNNVPLDDSIQCCGEDGAWKTAEPLNNDFEMQKYSAVFELITKAIKNRDYKIYKRGDKDLVDLYTNESLNLYDVILLIDEFEYPLPFFVFMGVTETEDKAKLLFITDGYVREFQPKLINDRL